ncbi:MAG: class I SAM-dependent methyltransferase [Ignavibacteriaceae bacterium]
MFEPVKEAFDRQSEFFDEYEEHNEILKRLRLTVRGHLLRHVKNGDNILELNAGTGLDAVFLAHKGYKIHAIDIAEGMLNKLEKKINTPELRDKVSFELLSFTELDKLKVRNFDYIFSNFGGLNCVDDLNKVTKHFNNILKPLGKITLVIMPPFSLWELTLALKGKFKPAFRRLHKNGTTANIEGIKFKTYYYNLKEIKHALGKEFKLIEVQGLASVSPPPYFEDFPLLHPVLYKLFTLTDKYVSHIFPFNRCADHLILTFRFMPK